MADAKAAAHVRWPEVKRELDRIVEPYNAQHDMLGVRLSLEEPAVRPGQLPPWSLTIHGDRRTLTALFTIGDMNRMGYRLTETTLSGYRFAIPDGLPKQGGVEDIGSFVKVLVAGVMGRSAR